VGGKNLKKKNQFYICRYSYIRR